MRISDGSSVVCASVQIAARRRRRDHRGDLQEAGYDARLRLGRLGLDYGLFRDGRRLTSGRFRSACNAVTRERVERMQSLERARPIWPILAAVFLSFGLLVASGAAPSPSPRNPHPPT